MSSTSSTNANGVPPGASANPNDGLQTDSRAGVVYSVGTPAVFQLMRSLAMASETDVLSPKDGTTPGQSDTDDSDSLDDIGVDFTGGMVNEDEFEFFSSSDGTPASDLTTTEEEDEIGELPQEKILNKHKVFHRDFDDQASKDTTEYMTNELSMRLAQIAVSNVGPYGGFERTTTATSIRDEDDKDGFAAATTQEEKEASSAEEMLGAIIEEFGEVTIGEEKEKFILDAKASLFRGVLLLGTLHLTSHRVTFHALLPPIEQGGLRKVVKAGPVFVNKPNRIKDRKFRVWLELGTDMITSYPDATEEGRTRPLKTILVSSIKSIKPLDPADPLSIRIVIATEKGDRSPWLSVDNIEEATSWRREMEGVLFHHGRLQLQKRKHQPFNSLKEDSMGTTTSGESTTGDDWDTIRISIPLTSIIETSTSNYFNFASIVSISIDVPPVEPSPPSGVTSPTESTNPIDKVSSSLTDSSIGKLLTTATSKSDGSTRSFRSKLFGKGAPTAAQLDEYPEPSEDKDRHFQVQFGVLSDQAVFVDEYNLALGQARSRQLRDVSESAKRPQPILDMEALFTREAVIAQGMDNYFRPNGGSHHEPHHESPTDLTSSPSVPILNARDQGTLEQKLLLTFAGGEGDTSSLWSTHCFLSRVLITRGVLVITKRYVGFYREAIAGLDVKIRYPIEDLKGAKKTSTCHLSTKGLSMQVQGHQDLLLEFLSKKSRDEAIMRLNQAVEDHSNQFKGTNSGFITPTTTAEPGKYSTSDSTTSTVVSELQRDNSSSAKSSNSALGRFSSSVRSDSPSRARTMEILSPSIPFDPERVFPDEIINYLPKFANLPGPAFKRIKPRHFCMLTIGSRGDIQPYIALSLRLMKDGHKCTIVTHDEFKKWVESFGIQHRQAGGDPAALMQLSVDHKMFSPSWFKISVTQYRSWLDNLFHDAWVACQDADVLIESPSAMAGIHIAEGLDIPYFRAFTMPWTRTHAYPQAFMVPPIEISGSFNYTTYVLFDNIIWKATAGQVNRWRKKDMGLDPTDMTLLEQRRVPFIYNFSSAVVPYPLDWSSNIQISGYWFLEGSDGANWTPPDDLSKFLLKAREDNKPLVYIGFGSIVVPHPAQLTRNIIKAVEKADVRAIVAKGWSGRGGGDEAEEDVPFPDTCYSIDKVPHDWLLPQMDAAVHHGGAGTTGASLRAGIPTIIRPFFGDQFFWAGRLEKLGAGIRVNNLASDEFAHALTRATTDVVMQEKAQKIGEKIRSENGVDEAVNKFYSYLETARHRHKNPHHEHHAGHDVKHTKTMSAPAHTVVEEVV